MRRILVVGSTGAGKTTAARRLAAAMELPFYEMDALAIGPQWSTPVDFVARVEGIVQQPAWVIDSYGHEAVRDAMWSAADTIVWLDYPLRLVLARVVRRSLRRSVTRTPIFGGNVETWRGWFNVDHPVWWAARRFRTRRQCITKLTSGKSAAHLTTVRLVSPDQFEQWLHRLIAHPMPRDA